MSVGIDGAFALDQKSSGWILRPNMIFHHLGHDMIVGIEGTCALDQKSRRWKLRQ